MKAIHTGRSIPRALALLAAAVGVLLLAGAVAPAADAASSTTSARPPEVETNLYSPLAAAWWVWALQQPNATNPLTDPDGANCAVAQRGPLWLLAGPTGEGSVRRACTIPANKALFFPLINYFSGATATDPDDVKNVPAQRALVAATNIKGATNLSVTVDGVAATKTVKYEDSVPFKVVLPADNIFGADAGTVVYPTVDSGYYALLAPLKPGHHTLRFTGQLPAATVLTEAVYDLTVKAR